jgi:hypothetical protein
MLHKLMTALGAGIVATTAIAAEPPAHAPYDDAAANAIYDLLFCDRLAAFAPRAGQAPTEWQRTLFQTPAAPAQLQALASDEAQEGRVRLLAYARLRALEQPVPSRVLLGVVVEVPLEQGLDVLAAYSDGGVRYINQTGRIAIFEPLPEFRAPIDRLFGHAERVVSVIGPWDDARRAPPPAGHVRLTFLVSDGLYFGEGPFDVLARDALAGPVIASATELLQLAVARASR